MITLVEKLNRALNDLHRGVSKDVDGTVAILHRLHCHLRGQEEHVSTRNAWRKSLEDIRGGDTCTLFYLDDDPGCIFAAWDVEDVNRWRSDMTSDSSDRAHAIWAVLRDTP